jgi:hypothetical protein
MKWTENSTEEFLIKRKVKFQVNKYENRLVLKNLKKKIIQISKNINKHNLTKVKGIFTGFQSLVADKNFHKFLVDIHPIIKKYYPFDFFIKDAWANILNEGDEVVVHSHNGECTFCGILYLTEGGPGTYFNDIDLNVEEEIGRYVLFDPLMQHSVKKIKNNVSRMTIAFNLVIRKEWQKIENIENLTILNK